MTGLMCGGVDAAATTMRRLRSGAAGPGETGETARNWAGQGAKQGRPGDVRRPRARRGTASVEAAGGGMGGVGGGTGLMCGGVDAAATTMRRLRSGAAGPGETGEKARTRIGSGAKPRRLI